MLGSDAVTAEESRGNLADSCPARMPIDSLHHVPLATLLLRGQAGIDRDRPAQQRTQ